MICAVCGREFTKSKFYYNYAGAKVCSLICHSTEKQKQTRRPAIVSVKFPLRSDVPVGTACDDVSLWWSKKDGFWLEGTRGRKVVLGQTINYDVWTDIDLEETKYAITFVKCTPAMRPVTNGGGSA